MKNQFIYIIIFLTTLYSQCDSYTSSECDSNSNCEWIENIESVTCSSLVWDEELCEASPDCTYSCWDAGGYFGWCEPACTGGMTYIDSGYCTEVEVLECAELNHGPCMNNGDCEWIDNTQTGSCSSLSLAVCDLSEYGSCYSDCTNWGSYYNGMFCYGTMYCAGGSYQIDTSYCEEVQYLSGDITGDFYINILDIIQIVNLILVSEYNMIVDMNNDNQLNVLDVILVVDIILGN